MKTVPAKSRERQLLEGYLAGLRPRAVVRADVFKAAEADTLIGANPYHPFILS